jgi:hypothetical protein
MRRLACRSRHARTPAGQLGRLALQLACVSLALARPGAGIAQPRGGFGLDWSAPAECPDSKAVERAVVDTLQHDTRDADLRATARITRGDADSYALTLQLDDNGARAERTLAGPDCVALARAAALLIALAIDPELRVPPVAQQATRSATEPPLPAPAETKALEPSAPPATSDKPAATSDDRAPSAARRESLAWGPRLGVIAQTAAGPGVGFGGALAIELALRWLRLSIGAQGALPRTAHVAALDDARVRIAAVMGTAGACARLLADDTFELAPCAELQLGALLGEASGIEQPKRGDALWFAIGAGLEGRARLGAGFALVAGANLLAPVARARFTVLDVQGPITTYRADPVSVQLGLAIAYQFR